MVQIAVFVVVGAWLVHATPGPALAGELRALSVEWEVSYATSAMPEVQILLRNSGERPVDFVCEVAVAPTGEEPDCEGDGSAPGLGFIDRFLRWDGVSRGISRGTVPARGWAHRSVALGSVGLVPPCRIPYRVRVVAPGETTPHLFEGVVPVAVVPALQEERGSGSELSWSAMVEEDSTYRDRVMARLLVENGADTPVRVLVSDRQLACSGNAAASWVLHKGALQGQDVGPLEIDARGWGVFVSPIELRGSKQAGDCEAVIELSVDGASGPKRVGKAAISLAITGHVTGGDE